MSKHDLITTNLQALTNTRSFGNAVRGWIVKRMIMLGSGPAQACELCGTRFRNGARIEHKKTDATIVVGGTCLRTILLSHFPPGCDIKAQRRDIRRKLETAYEGLIDPGNWIKWIVENAPPRLAHSAADLRHFAVLSSPNDLDRLIRFHDAKRQFGRAALLSNARSLEMVLRVKIPPYITIDQAKKYEAKLAAKPKRLKVPVISTEYARESVHPFIVRDPALNAVWKDLEPHERRAVAALAALDEKASPPDVPLCPDALALQWPTPTGTSLFVWHPKIGLGFVGDTDHLDGDKAYVWLWRSGSYQKSKYHLQYWRGVKRLLRRSGSGAGAACVCQVTAIAYVGRGWYIEHDPDDTHSVRHVPDRQKNRRTDGKPKTRVGYRSLFTLQLAFELFQRSCG